VGNLDPTIDEETLKAVFITFGDIKNAEIPKDMVTGQQKGFGFVEFEDKKDADAAIDNFDDAEVFGRIIRVKKAKPLRMKASSTRAIWADESWHKKNLEKTETENLDTENPSEPK